MLRPRQKRGMVTTPTRSQSHGDGEIRTGPTDDGSQIGYLRRQVALGELDTAMDKPLISALVVSTVENLRSGGFRNVYGALGLHVGSRWGLAKSYWVSEMKPCWRANPAAALASHEGAS